MSNMKILDHRGAHIEKAFDLDPSFFTQGRGMFNVTESPTFKDATTRPYQFHPLAHASAMAILKAVSRLPIIMTKKSNPSEIMTDHEVLTLLRNPNPIMTKTTFFQAVILGLLLSTKNKDGGGQSFLIALDKDLKSTVDLVKGEIPTMLIPYTGQNVTPRTIKADSGVQTLAGWNFSPTGNNQNIIKYLPNELIRIFQFNPYNWLGGIANYEPAQTAIIQDIKSDLHNSQLLDNNNVPIGVLTSDATISKDQRKKLIDSWGQHYGGIAGSNSGSLAVLDKNFKYQHIGLTNADMQYDNMKKDAMEKIIASFGLNKIALGNYEKINLATIREGRLILWEDVYIPMAELIEDAINSQWIKWIDDDLLFKFDLTNVPALKTTLKEKIVSAGIMSEKNFVPTKIAYRILDIPLTEQDLIDAPWLTENPAELKRPTEAPPPEAASIQKELTITDIAINDEIWDTYVKQVTDPSEKKYSKEFNDFFRRQRNDMQDKVDMWAKTNKGMKIVVKIKKPNADDFLLDKKSEDKKILQMTKLLVRGTVGLEANLIADELNGLEVWKATKTKVEGFIDARKIDTKKINTTTFKSARREINIAIEEGIKKNETIQEIAKRLKKAISKTMDARIANVIRIARTETGIVSGMVRNDIYKDEGIKKVVWLTARDEKIRTLHKIEGQERELGKKFSNGLKFPHDPDGAAENIINCRCTMRPAD